MLYHSNEARETAKEGILYCLKKLATLKPTDNFDIGDIRKTRYYLEVLANGIQSEIYKENRREHEAEYQRRKEAEKAGA